MIPCLLGIQYNEKEEITWMVDPTYLIPRVWLLLVIFLPLTPLSATSFAYFLLLWSILNECAHRSSISFHKLAILNHCISSSFRSHSIYTWYLWWLKWQHIYRTVNKTEVFGTWKEGIRTKISSTHINTSFIFSEGAI